MLLVKPASGQTAPGPQLGTDQWGIDKVLREEPHLQLSGADHPRDDQVIVHCLPIRAEMGLHGSAELHRAFRDRVHARPIEATSEPTDLPNVASALARAAT